MDDLDLERRPWVKVTSLGVFAAGFILLLASVAAVGLGQFEASSVAAWLSLAFSAGAVAFTVAAVLMRSGR
jgi:hypothetical protein